MKKIISAGHICLDITPVFPAGHSYDRIGDLLVPGKLIRMDAASVHTGGSVANTGLALKLLGNEVTLLGKVGRDALGGMVYRTGSRDRMAQVGARLELSADAWADRSGRQPCYRAGIVRSATGAGDVSIAAYLTALMNGETPADCAKLAAAEGAASVSSYDALGGILPLNELKQRIAEYGEKRTCL